MVDESSSDSSLGISRALALSENEKYSLLAKVREKHAARQRQQ